MLRPGQHKAALAACASGVLSALAFPPFAIRPLCFVAPLLLLWALSGRARKPSGRTAFLLGWGASFCHFLVVLHWILWLPSEEVTIPGLMAPALVFLGAYLSIFPGLAALGATVLSRRLSLPLGPVWALLYAAGEVLRSSGELAFPWGTPAYALAPVAPAVQFVSITGFWGLALWLAMFAGLLHEGLRSGSPRRLRWGMAATAWFLAAWIHGAVVLANAGPAKADSGEGPLIVLIQPNVPREIKWDPDFRGIVTEDLLRRTELAAIDGPDLIVWPETAVPMALLQEPYYLARVTSTARRIATPILAGTLDEEIGGGSYTIHNSVALIDTSGAVAARYDKQRLVPFSERMPFQKAAPWLGALNFGQSDFTPGASRVLFDVSGAPIACLICFESIFPDLAAAFSRDGAGLFINITNDFWFGDTAAPVQHAEMAILRAVETRTPLLRCANTGISFVVDRFGRVMEKTGTFEEAVIAARLLPSARPTFASRRGELLARQIILGASVALILLSIPYRKSR